MLIGTEGEGNRDYDYLASIEILIMDQAQVFTMQVGDGFNYLKFLFVVYWASEDNPNNLTYYYYPQIPFKLAIENQCL